MGIKNQEIIKVIGERAMMTFTRLGYELVSVSDNHIFGNNMKDYYMRKPLEEVVYYTEEDLRKYTYDAMREAILKTGELATIHSQWFDDNFK